MTSGASYQTAGEALELECELGWVAELLEGTFATAAGGTARQGGPIKVHIEGSTGAFPLAGMAPLSRSAWSRDREVVAQDVGGSGFDLHARVDDGCAEFTYRWRPARSRAAARLLMPVRFTLLAREILLQYPVLWWASRHGRAPLHASACTAADSVALLAGPGGVGKSTLLSSELRYGASATSDNLCVSDGRGVWGLVEPMRIEGGSGRRVTHGRVELPLAGRVDHLVPDHVIVVRRTDRDAALLAPCDPDVAFRSLVTGTYSAGELSRFWGFAATLAAGTGVGPAHPAVAETARVFTSRLRCSELLLPRRPGTRLAEVLNPVEAIA